MPLIRAGNVPVVWALETRSVSFYNRIARITCVRLLAIAAALSVATALRAQDSNPAVEQSRLFPRTIPPSTNNVSPETLSAPQGQSVAPEDESFGAQQILKPEEKVPEFLLTAGSSVYFTSNVALTRSDTQSEAFYVGETAFSWTPRLNPQLQFQLGAALSLFRYETSALDFESLGTGTGLVWTPPKAWGLAFISRYDFIELLDRHADEILQDHQFSLAVQKLFALGRSHWLSFGIIGSAGISDPVREQRDQAGFAVGYHLQVARQFGADLGYRHSWYFYNEGGRTDLNQVFSLGLHYNFSPGVAVNGYVSGATNYSNQSVFKYDVFSGGGGLGLIIRF
jgi:hypothetical protein